MADNPGKGREQESDFHETDYYSNFGEQEADLSKSAESAQDPSGEIDEDTIQDLMDATLGRKEAAPHDDLGELDTEVRSDWHDPEREEAEPPTAAGVSKRGVGNLSPPKTIRKASAKGVVGKRKLPRNRKRWWQSKRRMAGAIRMFCFLFLFGLLIGGIWYSQVTGRDVLGELETEAGRLHREGKYAEAIDAYREIESLVAATGQYRMEKLHFLMGAAFEGEWNNGRGPSESFERSLENYDLAVELDETDMKAYAVESLLAEAEMWVEKSRVDGDGEMLDRARNILEEVIADSRYATSPMVSKGIPHRRLANLIREEDPIRAVDLLIRARKNQGDLEEGYENLEIGLIYKDLLDDPDQAVEFFERVKQNELAPREVKQFAEQNLDRLKATSLEAPGMFSTELLETIPGGGDPR